MKNILTAIFLFCAAGNSYGQIITTIAGGGTAGAVDGVQATATQLNDPYGIATDGAGNIYFADRNNNRIRKINTAGIITTIAGTGSASFSGDGGPATAAKIDYPFGVALDGAGNIYFADRMNERIRKIDASGIITTIAGTGTAGYNGEGTAATLAQLSAPCGVAVDAAGNIYFCDTYNNRVRKINSSGIISTIAGTGTMGYSGDGSLAVNADIGHPYGLTIDNIGNLYFTEWVNNTVRKINTTGIITTVAGKETLGFSGDGGAATQAEFNRPVGVAVDVSGNIYVADAYNYRVRKISSSGIITTYAGNGGNGFSGDGGPAALAELGPTGVCFDNTGTLFITDFRNERIRRITSTVFVKNVGNINMRMDLYPNPSSGNFKVEVLANFEDEISIEVCDGLGRSVKRILSKTNSITEVEIDAPAGLYFVSVGVRGEVCSRKLVLLK